MSNASANGSDQEPDDNQTPFERFKDLARRLVAVPKAEVDALRKKQQQARRRSRA